MSSDADPRPSTAPALTVAGAEALADVMFSLAAPSRLQILDSLRDGPLSVTEIVERVAMEQSAVSHQLRVLRDHGVLTVQRRGRHRLYRLSTPHVAELIADGRDHLDALRDGPTEARTRQAAG